MTETEVYAFMAQHKLGVLSHSADDGSPRSSLVGIAATPELEIVFDTVKSSRKYPNLAARPACSFVIGWEGERTLQFEGMAQDLGEPELSRYQQVYFSVWPECRAHLSWPGITYFLVKPRWIRYSDFDRNPPLIEELQIR